MKTVTPTELRANIYKLLDEVLQTGAAIEVRRGHRTLRITPVEQPDKFQNLTPRPQVIQGDPDALAALSWEDEVSLDLP